MHNVLSLKQGEKNKISNPNQSTMALLTHWEATINHKNPFDLISLFVFDTSVWQSPSAHKINFITLSNKKKKTIDCTGPKFVHLCIYVCKIDDIQLCFVSFAHLGPARFFGSTYKHTAQNMYKPWIYEQGRKEQRGGQSTEWSLIKMGQHMVNHLALRACSALIKCT